MNPSEQIFQTQNKIRWLGFKWTTRIIFASILFLIIVTGVTILNAKNPNLPILEGRAKAYQAKLDPTNPFTLESKLNKKYKGFKDYLHKKEVEDSIKTLQKNSKNSNLIRAAFYTPWDKSALLDLIQNADKLNTIYPEWFFIDTNNFQLQTRIDSAGLMAMKKAHLSIQPIFNNFRTSTKQGQLGDFDSHLAHVILNDPARQKKIIQQIVDTLTHYQLQGINVDFENLQEKGNESLTNFQKNLYESLHAKNLLVSMDVQSMNEDYDFKNLDKYNDHIVLMAYDQFSDATDAGPISSQKWIEQQMDWIDNYINPSKIILGVAGYARDWSKEQTEKGIKKEVSDLTYASVIAKAKLVGGNIQFDNNSYNLHFDYIEPETDTTAETKHQIWLTDAATTFNILRFSDDYKNAGTALWRLGGEDPRIWNYYGRDLSSTSLKTNPFKFETLSIAPIDINQKPTATGEGELLRIIYGPQQGKIKLEIDSAEMLISEQQYLQLPSGYVYEKFAEDKTPIGQAGHKIILTFDDGPDEIFTPKILSILQKEKVPATFFVVGINAERNIPLLQKIYNRGYEIGNHTFTHGNIAIMSPERAELEMKTTRSLIECVTGHSTILFRAPYNADSEPQSYEEIEPIARSKKDNYISVGESIDPNDWDPKMNADSIFNRTVRFAEQNNANIILLHDAGGKSRQPTVDALPRIIKYFKNRGCEFTTVAALMGKSRNDVMPIVQQSWKNKANWLVVETGYWFINILFSLFLIGIILSIGRMAIMGILASIQMRKENKNSSISTLKNSNYPTPLVSVIVPAYNEQLNAVRTIESLLQQNYPSFQIIFVDDGSKDNSFDIVSQTFVENQKVMVLTKPNGGKASALNYGIQHAEGDYVVCIDADTQLKHDAITLLMFKFELDNKPEGAKENKIAAVAGNVKVGNEINMITKWQSIEYITSQNFDRRAFDLLDCITVVPGAIGAFKKDAVVEAGGFTTDTLAEDCDLTIRLHKLGYKVRNCTEAISFTEAPETMRQFLKQRFRWSFGVIQCFWKHRETCFNPRYKNLGMVAMPNILIFQMILPMLAPLADIFLVLSLIAAGLGIMPASIEHIVFYYIIFSLVDVVGAMLAFSFEKENYKKLLWLIPQRLIYRQLMYYILIKSFLKAIKGELQGWGVLKRTGNVKQVVSNASA